MRKGWATRPYGGIWCGRKIKYSLPQKLVPKPSNYNAEYSEAQPFKVSLNVSPRGFGLLLMVEETYPAARQLEVKKPE
jgi:hypothetical protein